VLLVVAGAVGAETGVPGSGVPGSGVLGAFDAAAGVPGSPRRAVVSAAAKAAIRVEW
jgi:hypothetical protein